MVCLQSIVVCRDQLPLLIPSVFFAKYFAIATEHLKAFRAVWRDRISTKEYLVPRTIRDPWSARTRIFRGMAAGAWAQMPDESPESHIGNIGLLVDANRIAGLQRLITAQNRREAALGVRSTKVRYYSLRDNVVTIVTRTPFSKNLLRAGRIRDIGVQYFGRGGERRRARAPKETRV